MNNKRISRKQRALSIESLESRQLCAIDVKISTFSLSADSGGTIVPRAIRDGFGYYANFAMDFSAPIDPKSLTRDDIVFTSFLDGNLLRPHGVYVSMRKIDTTLPHLGFSDNTYLVYTNNQDSPPLVDETKRGNYTFGINGTVQDTSGNIIPINSTVSWTSNRQPYLTMDKANISTFTEEQPAIAVSPGATVFDPESPNFNGGKFTASISQNGTQDDQLFIDEQGDGIGQVNVTGANVTVGGVVIGTFTGGVGANPLVVTFNDQANAVNTQSLVRAIMFQNNSDNPSTAPRTISYSMGDGGIKNPKVPLANFTKTVNVVGVNNGALITASGSLNYSQGSAALPIAPIAQLIDADSNNYRNGKLKISGSPTLFVGNRMIVSSDFG